MAIYPIQDTVLAMYTMTCSVPPERPFCIPAADLFSLLMTVRENAFGLRDEVHVLVELITRIRKTWKLFADANPLHPTVHTLNKLGIEFEYTGAGVLSCLLPETTEYMSTETCSDPYQSSLRPGRQLPLRVTRGIIVQGVVTNRHIGPNAAGLLAHVACYHGKAAAMDFTNQMQVLASCITMKATATFSLYDCMLPQSLSHHIKRDMDEQLHQAAIMRTSGTRCVAAGMARQQALHHLLRARERSEWIVSRYIRAPFHYTEYLEQTVLAEEQSRNKMRIQHPSSSVSSMSETDRQTLLQNLIVAADLQRKHDNTFDHFDRRNQAGLMLDSQCKGTVSGISQVFEPLGQYALGEARHIVENTFGRTQALYRGPHIIACMTPQSWHIFAGTYYKGADSGRIASISTAILPQNDTFNRRPPPLPPHSAGIDADTMPSSTVAATTDAMDCETERREGDAQFHAARLFGHANTPTVLRRTLRGRAYQRSIFETGGPNTRLCEMKTHLQYQGFNSESGLGIGLRPTNYAIYAMCARHSLVGVTCNTSHGTTKKMFNCRVVGFFQSPPPCLSSVTLCVCMCGRNPAHIFRCP